MMLSELPFLEVSFGVGGVQLFSVESLEDAQVGYARTSDGRSLTGNGGWRANWTVVGQQTCCGDPIFVDETELGLPVFTAVSGQGVWNPQKIAISLEAFAACLQALAAIASGRGTPVALEENPVVEAERKAFLSQVERLNQGRITTAFWDLLISF